MIRNLGSKTFGSEWVGMESDVDIYGYRVYSDRGEELGTVLDYVFDEEGHVRYLVLELGFWIFGKNVLMPVGLVTHVDDRQRRLTAGTLKKEDFEDLAGFESLSDFDSDYYERDVLAFYCRQSDCALPGPQKGFRYEDFPVFRTPDRLLVLEDRVRREIRIP